MNTIKEMLLKAAAECIKAADEFDEAYDPKPKAPTHEEIMAKWWKIDKGWWRVTAYEPSSVGYCYYIKKVWQEKTWFTGHESATIPPEAEA